VTCAGSGATTYHPELLHCEPGAGVCGTVAGLLPGDWIHRITVTVPGSDTQEQAQRSVLISGDPVASNVVVWTVYPRTFSVTSTASDDSSGSLRDALTQAATYAAGSGSTLVAFSRDAFQGADTPQTIDLASARCDPDTHYAAICFRGSGV